MIEITNDTKSNIKFLMLIDFSKGSYRALDYLIKLVKVTGGRIEIFSISEPCNLVKSENPVVALRSIAEDKVLNKIRLDSIVEMIQSEGIKVKYSLSTGRLIDRLNDKLKPVSTEIVVIGNSKPRAIGKTTNYLLNKFKGNLLVIKQHSKFKKTATDSITNTNGTTINLESRETSRDIEEIKQCVSSNNIDLHWIKRSNVKTSILNRLFHYNNPTVRIVKTTKPPLLIIASK